MATGFFGEPALSLDDLMQTVDGKGVINVLAADKLLSSPRLYSTFLLWMLSGCSKTCPKWATAKTEVGVLLR